MRMVIYQYSDSWGYTGILKPVSCHSLIMCLGKAKTGCCETEGTNFSPSDTVYSYGLHSPSFSFLQKCKSNLIFFFIRNKKTSILFPCYSVSHTLAYYLWKENNSDQFVFKEVKYLWKVFPLYSFCRKRDCPFP